MPSDDEFTFTHAGKTYRLPPFNRLKAGTVRKIRKLDDADATFTLLEKIADAKTLAAIDDMDIEELGDVMKAWKTHAGVSLGESDGSSA